MKGKTKEEILEKQYDKLKASCSLLVEGLEKIENPIKFFQLEADKEGATLNGLMTMQIANDPNYLKNIAKQVLDNYRKTEK